MQNYYELLEVPTYASKKEIRRAYLEKCKQYHPDLHEGAAWAEAKLKSVNEAYETLSDAFARQTYDANLLDALESPIKTSLIPSVQEIKKRPIWLYGSLLALSLWITVIALVLYQPTTTSIIKNKDSVAKNEYRRFLAFCKAHPKLITRAEFQKVLDHPPVIGFTFELDRLIAKGDTLAIRKRIQELEE